MSVVYTGWVPPVGEVGSHPGHSHGEWPATFYKAMKNVREKKSFS